MPSKYEKIISTIEKKIESGIWPTGMLMPTESELCTLFEVSRITVRRALAELRNWGWWSGSRERFLRWKNALPFHRLPGFQRQHGAAGYYSAVHHNHTRTDHTHHRHRAKTPAGSRTKFFFRGTRRTGFRSVPSGSVAFLSVAVCGQYTCSHHA